jgi:hypothetical protein
MRVRYILGLAASLSLFSALQATAQLTAPIGVEFRGRDEYTAKNPACIGLQLHDVTGVVPQQLWNPIDNWYNADLYCPIFPANCQGTSPGLTDGSGNITAVTISFFGNDSWDNDVNYTNISSNPDAVLMQGTMKSTSGGGVPAYMTFNNVPAGQYDVYVYCDMDADNVVGAFYDQYGGTTNYIKEFHQFYATNTFIQSHATTAGQAQATNNPPANYVKLSIGTDVRAQIGVRGSWVSGGNGIGITGIQLVPAGPVAPNTQPLSLLSEPISRRGADGTNDITFTCNVKGQVSYGQWFQNGVALPGETNFDSTKGTFTYTPNPISAATMQGAQIHFFASNNVNSVTTSNAVLTVGQLITIGTNVVLDGGFVNITTQPTNPPVKVAGRGTPAAFFVAATSGFIGDASGASPPIYYQWQSAPKGSSTFTDIAGATKTSYRTALLQLADDGTQFRAVVQASDGITNSSIATVTVLPNTNPPTATVGAIVRSDGVTEVGVSFDEQVLPSTFAPGNFSLNAGSITGVKAATNSYVTYTSVILQTTGLTPGSTYTLTAHGITDTSGNVLPSTNISFTVPIGIQWAELGSPPAPGQVIPVGKDGFDILNGGRQEWSTYDEVDMAYVIKTNDFDVKVQVLFVEPASKWTRCGLQARNALNIGEPSSDHTNSTTTAAAYAQTHVNANLDLADTGLWPPGDPNQPGNPVSNNGHEQNQRLTKGGATSGWGAPVGGAAGIPSFPDVWLRLARKGSTLQGYSSTDGVTWVDQGTTTLTDQQNYMYVGASLSVETGNIWSTFDVWNAPFDPTYDRLFVGQFRNFGDVVSTVTPTIGISGSGSSITITYTGTLQSSPALGTNANWTAVSGATSPYTVPTPKPAPMLFYRSSQ